VRISLGLLPSGPDPVGEEHVRANLPRAYMLIYDGKCKRQADESWNQVLSRVTINRTSSTGTVSLRAKL
jgi:hypothetical protein